MMSYKNPTINLYSEPLDNNEFFNTGEEDFAVAFALESFQAQPLDDKRYIKWEVIVWEYLDGVLKNVTYDLNPCTYEEIARFSPPNNKHTKKKVAKL